jgi:hypothetical protein
MPSNTIDKPIACLGICHLIVFFMNKDELEIVGEIHTNNRWGKISKKNHTCPLGIPVFLALAEIGWKFFPHRIMCLQWTSIEKNKRWTTIQKVVLEK